MIFNFFGPKSPSGNFGQFQGNVQCKWVDVDHPTIKDNNPERQVTLTHPFSYQGPDGYLWTVPAESTVDGASIPILFWKIVGSPYVGNYRRASVIHDHFCYIWNEHSKTAKDVHKMFYFACRAGQTSPLKAAVMYWAICWFGPHWQDGIKYRSLAWYYITTPWRMFQPPQNPPPVSMASSIDSNQQ